MLVVRTDIPKAYFAANAGAKGLQAAERQYQAWLTLAKAATWSQPADVTTAHPKASILKASRAVFNIKGNSYRLVCKINYPAAIVQIRFFGTHAAYDDINAETV